MKKLIYDYRVAGDSPHILDFFLLKNQDRFINLETQKSAEEFGLLKPFSLVQTIKNWSPYKFGKQQK